MKFDLLKEFIEYINLKKNTYVISYRVTHYSEKTGFWDLIDIKIISTKDTSYEIIGIILNSENMKLESYTIDGNDILMNIIFSMKDILKEKK